MVGLALAFVMIVAAAEASVAAASRARMRSLAGQGSRRAERLQIYASERASVLAVLSIVRLLAIVTAAGVATFLITRETGHGWGIIAIVTAAAVVALALADAIARLIVARSPDVWGLRLVPVITAFRAVFGPVAWAIDRSLATFVPTAEEEAQDETEEILRRAEIEHDGEVIEEDERQMIRGIIEMDDTFVREIMAPRIDIVALEVNETIDDAMKLIVARGFSRIPLYDETVDNIVGIIYAKDLMRCLTENRRPSLRDVARPPYFIPESKRVDELLDELRLSKVHIAIVVDEYGGTAGLVTIEDLLEEIVGEIQDEYDREEAPIERISESEAILDARVSIDALAELFGYAPAEDEDYDSIGGFVYHHLGKVPAAGDEVRVDGLTLRVLSVLGRRIKKVRATRVEAHESAAAS